MSIIVSREAPLEKPVPTISLSLSGAVVVVSSDRAEFMRLASAARALKFKGIPLVFVRYGDDKRKAAEEMAEDAKAAGFPGSPHHVFLGVSTGSVTDELADNGYEIKLFLGSHPEQVGVTRAKRKKPSDKSAGIPVRFACICNNCESVIREHVYTITPEQEGSPGEFQHSESTSTEWDASRRRYNVLDMSQRCRGGC